MVAGCELAVAAIARLGEPSGTLLELAAAAEEEHRAKARAAALKRSRDTACAAMVNYTRQECRRVVLSAAGLRVQDEAGFTAFVAARGPALLRLGWLLTANAGAGQDLAQESLTRLVRHWDRLTTGPQQADPEVYAWAAMRTIWIDSWRRRRGWAVEPVATTGLSTEADGTLVQADPGTVPPIDPIRTTWRTGTSGGWALAVSTGGGSDPNQAGVRRLTLTSSDGVPDAALLSWTDQGILVRFTRADAASGR